MTGIASGRCPSALAMTSVAVLKGLCARAGMRPEKSSGQHFLVSRATLDRIVAAVDPQPTDTILEVGAGFGVLTTALAERIASPPFIPPPHGMGRGKIGGGVRRGCIIAIERDRHITPILKELVAPYGNVEVVEGNVLRLLSLRGRSRSNPGQLGTELSAHGRDCFAVARNDTEKVFKVAANLPYSITSDFLRLLFDRVADGSLPTPERAVLLLQREVVDRLCADPAQQRERKNVGMLTVLTQLHCTARRIARVPPSAFWPPPKVESAVVVLEHWRSPEEIREFLGGVSRDEFLRIVHVCFARRRAQLQTTVSHVIARPQPKQSRSTGDSALHSWPGLLRFARNDKAFWDAIGIPPTARPETLSIAEWIALSRALQS